MKILVTGREGQIARSLVEQARGRPNIVMETVGRPELDLVKPESVMAAIRERKPDLVVSAAAYTAVDQAEDDVDMALTVNAGGARAAAKAAAELGVPVVHLSTDYVFSGDKAGAYLEDDPVGPQSAYGRTKLAGEVAVADANPKHVILRTAWAYSPFGRNFVKTMLAQAQTRSSIGVVCDQFGNPTSALDIADGILHIARALAAMPSADKFGIFHLAGTGSTSWAGFAENIFVESRSAGGPFAAVQRISTAEYPSKAKRPANSRLSTDKLARVYGWRAPDWRLSCADIVRRLVQEAAPT
ncbi:NAD(P)-dependent oxidoreductase [Terrihabitans soli]|uniref:dTDP-4-dehydrorhamnose reductase n=1 Tax=Terrihabitans soli TaxID=708113 RepID=A0A6S6QWK8_9HYPH|nr:dTDP-4-dehydrorhamnose reductase [Terrihabitans soli]BCJ92307.1 NAD(P)-dependent oxidoreductase [Terrihabitans soli]